MPSPNRRSVSVRADVHAAAVAGAKARGVTLAALAEAALADLPAPAASPDLVARRCSGCRRVEPHRPVATVTHRRLACTCCGREALEPMP